MVIDSTRKVAFAVRKRPSTERRTYEVALAAPKRKSRSDFTTLMRIVAVVAMRIMTVIVVVV
jgi:hypothetical protein